MSLRLPVCLVVIHTPPHQEHAFERGRPPGCPGRPEVGRGRSWGWATEQAVEGTGGSWGAGRAETGWGQGQVP